MTLPLSEEPGTVTPTACRTEVARRWFSWPTIALLSPVPIATALIVFGVPHAFFSGSKAGAFVGVICLFAFAYIGIVISLWPIIVPNHYALWQAASSERTRAFVLIGTLVLLPVVFAYSGWPYWVFRGKVRGWITKPTRAFGRSSYTAIKSQLLSGTSGQRKAK